MRFWEIDALRGLAVIIMVIYHTLVDLQLFYNWQIGVFDYPAVLLAKISGVTFIFLLGLSAYLRYQKEKSTKPIIKKAFILLSWAVVISITTFVLFPNEFIYFGILHLLGTSLLLLIPLLYVKSNQLLFILGLTVIILGFIIKTSPIPSLDFYPIFPWFGLTIWGMLFAKLTLNGTAKQSLKPRFNFLQKLGRHSLLIYLIHQPILLSVLYLISKIRT